MCAECCFEPRCRPWIIICTRYRWRVRCATTSSCCWLALSAYKLQCETTLLLSDCMQRVTDSLRRCVEDAHHISVASSSQQLVLPPTHGTPPNFNFVASAKGGTPPDASVAASQRRLEVGLGLGVGRRARDHTHHPQASTVHVTGIQPSASCMLPVG